MIKEKKNPTDEYGKVWADRVFKLDQNFREQIESMYQSPHDMYLL